MYHVFALHPKAVRSAAAFLHGFIEKARSRETNVTVAELLDDCEDQCAVFWVVMGGDTPVGIAITRIFRQKIEVTMAAGREGCRWAPVLRERLRQFRRDEDAEWLECHGRKGWGRVLGMEPYGYSPEIGWTFKDYG